MRAAVIGVAVSALSGFLLWSYLKRFEDEASGGPKVAVVTVLHTVEPGAVIKEGDLGERLIPQAYVESRMIRVGDRAKIANLRVWTPLDAQQILNWTDIAANVDDGRVSSRVQPSMRAMTVHTDANSAAIVRPGDRVDVIATLPSPKSDQQRVGIVLLQNILVLGRSTTSGVGAAGTESGSDIALSLTLQAAQTVATAADKAKLSVALRADSDSEKVSNMSEMYTGDLLNPVAKPQMQGGAKGPIEMKPR